MEIKMKISALQMSLILFPTLQITSLLVMPSITSRYAERDMWMTPLWAAAGGFLVVFVACKLSELYPGESVVQYSEHILGRVIGKCVALIFPFFYLHIAGIAANVYGEFISVNFLPKTPINLLMGSLIFVSALAVYGGIEVLARCALILVPIGVLIITILYLMLFNDLQPNNMLPLMDNGLAPSLIGATQPLAWLGLIFVISFLLPFLKKQEKGMKWGMLAVTAVVFYMVLSNMMILFLFGDITSKLNFPIIIAARYINIFNFFQHVEAIVMAIWVVGVFIQISLFLFVIVLSIAQWLKLNDYRIIVFPVGFLLTFFSIWSAPNLPYTNQFISATLPFYVITLQIVLPIGLLSLAFIRQKFRKSKGSQRA